MLRFSRRVVSGCALLACGATGSLAWAGANEPFSLAPSSGAPLYADTAAVAPAQPAEEQRPLMGLLAPTPIGQALRDTRINVYGWIEGSYEYNFQVHHRIPNAGRIFDLFENNKGYLNQADITLERTVDLSTHQVEVGGRVDVMYGSDSRFTVASGMLDKQGPRNAFGIGSQEAWLDIPQAYIDIAVPIGEGVRVRIGKFELFKTTDPNASAFYTHPFEYETFPFTLTGISLFTPISKTCTIEGGVARGWDQSLTDDNSAAVDGFFRVVCDTSDRSRLTASVISGPEQFHDSGDFTTAVDVSFQYVATDQLTLLLGGIYGHQVGSRFGLFPGTDPNTVPPGTVIGSGGASNWYGVNGTAIVKINDQVSLNGRLEWYRDEEGFTTIGAREGVNLYEATVGVSLTPFHSTPLGDNFVVRPEVRYDYASRAFFGNATRHDQLTAAIDAIFNF